MVYRRYAVNSLHCQVAGWAAPGCLVRLTPPVFLSPDGGGGGGRGLLPAMRRHVLLVLLLFGKQ